MSHIAPAKIVNSEKSLTKFLLKPLVAALFTLSMLATSTVAIADSCSCNSDSSLPSLTIEESNEAHPNQFILKANNAYHQLLDQDGRVLQDRLYEVMPFSDGRIIAKRDGKFGLIGTQGELIFAFNYEGIEILPANLYLLSKQQGAGYSSALVRGANDWLYPASGKFADKTTIEQLYYDESNSIGYFKVIENGKVGLINDQKQTLIPNRYDELNLLDTCPNERLFMTVKLGDKTGLIDQYQKFVIPLEKNQTIENFNEDEQIFKVSKFISNAYDDTTIISEKLVKGKGEILLESDSAIKNVVDNLYQYSSNNKYGVINNKAEIIATATFDYISSDASSALVVTKGDKQGILQKQKGNNQLIVNKYYDQLQEAYMDDKTLEQLRMVESEEALAEDDSNNESDIDAEDEINIDTTAEAVVDTEYDDYRFRETLFIARDNNKYGLIDSADRIRIPFLYDDIKLSTNILLVKKEQKYGLLTSHNETVAGIFYDDIELIYNAQEELVYRVTKGDQQGLIDSTGKSVFPVSSYQIIDETDDIRSKFVIMGSNGKYGLLSEDSRSILIPAKYEKIDRELSNYNIIAQMDGKRVLIDNYGQVLPADFSQFTEINELDETGNLLVTSDNDKQGVVDSKGKIIVTPVYESINPILFAYYSDDDRTNYYRVERDGYYGLLDTMGKTIIKPKYTDIESLNYAPYLIVSESKSDSDAAKFGLIDNKGKVLKSLKYDAIEETYYGEDDQIVLVMSVNDTVEIYDTKLKLIKKMSLEEFEQDR